MKEDYAGFAFLFEIYLPLMFLYSIFYGYFSYRITNKVLIPNVIYYIIICSNNFFLNLAGNSEKWISSLKVAVILAFPFIILTVISSLITRKIYLNNKDNTK
ncbi:MAG TPA: hypothetical protein DCP51_09095 [Clostridiales bacterium]|nr:hypothetical protein [Clostridiales bacterium]